MGKNYQTNEGLLESLLMNPFENLSAVIQQLGKKEIPAEQLLANSFKYLPELLRLLSEKKKTICNITVSDSLKIDPPRLEEEDIIKMAMIECDNLIELLHNIKVYFEARTPQQK